MTFLVFSLMLSSASVVAGVLSLPRACALLGWVLGPSFLVIFGLLSMWTSIMLTEVGVTQYIIAVRVTRCTLLFFLFTGFAESDTVSDTARTESAAIAYSCQCQVWISVVGLRFNMALHAPIPPLYTVHVQAGI